MLPRTLKLAAGLILAASLVAGAVALRPAATTAQPPANPIERPPDATNGSTTYSGRVVDPDGKPVAGAKLYAVYYTPKVLPIPVRATSDKEGNFRFTVAHKEFDRGASARPWDETVVYAVADGYGINLFSFDPAKPWSHTDQTLRLTKDEPITGKITDLQGKPVAGVSVSVWQLWWPTDGKDLSALLDAVKAKEALVSTMIERRFGQTGLWMGRDVGRILPPAVSDKEGRFTLKGVGRERVVSLRIDGSTITASELWAMTRANENLRVMEHSTGGGEVRFVGTSFEHIAAPAQPITGTVTDKDTGKPIAGATLEGYQLRRTTVSPTVSTTTDKEGRYRLAGVPKGPGARIRVRSPANEPYLSVEVGAGDNPGLVPVTVDIALMRGVWITGKVTANGKPAGAWVDYAVYGDNPNIQGAPGLSLERDLRNDPADGTFRIVGLPGRGIVAVRAHQSGYRTRVGADKIKDLDRFTIPAGGAIGIFNQEFNAIAEVNAEPGAESASCELVLQPAVSLTGRVVDPDGRPLAGATIRGLEHPEVWSGQQEGEKFVVLDVHPDEPRLIQVTHAEKKLAGSVVVHGDEKGPISVKLEPAGALTGRFVTTDGKPLAELPIYPITMEPLADPRMRVKFSTTAGSFPRNVRTDKDGRFRIEGLAPGLTYRLAIARQMFVLEPEGAKGVTVKAGETRDLGDLRVKLPGED